jgi:hypothetical protein
MPTNNPRINITFEKVTAKLLMHIAEHEHKSTASVAKELILEALELREDIALSTLATIREAESNKKKRIKHDDAWK